MAFSVGRYGVEFDPERREEGTPPALRWLVAAVVAVAAASLVVTVVKRVRARVGEEPPPEPPAVVQPAPAGGRQPAAAPAAPVASAAPAQSPAPPPAVPPVAPPSDLDRRPPKVRGLLLRLEKAEAAQDVEMAISTIEQIRAQPGQPAADIDDRLARRLGELNVAWLFERMNAQWVKDVKVKPGDSATRIARENASTLASLKRLNPGLDVDRLRAGAVIKVMNQPRFNLVVHKRVRTADLQLNGKFFKRYDLSSDVKGEPGAYTVADNFRQLLADKGVWFRRPDRTELETLMPKGSSITISEL